MGRKSISNIAATTPPNSNCDIFAEVVCKLFH